MGQLFGLPAEYFLISGILILNIIMIIPSYRAQSIFPDTSTIRKRYKDNYISGFSDKNAMASIVQARRTLEVIVTDDELWIRPTFRLTPFGKMQDLIHKIPLDKIIEVTAEDEHVDIKFSDDKGKSRNIHLNPIRIKEFRNHVLRNQK